MYSYAGSADKHGTIYCTVQAALKPTTVVYESGNLCRTYVTDLIHDSIAQNKSLTSLILSLRSVLQFVYSNVSKCSYEVRCYEEICTTSTQCIHTECCHSSYALIKCLY